MSINVSIEMCVINLFVTIGNYWRAEYNPTEKQLGPILFEYFNKYFKFMMIVIVFVCFCALLDVGQTKKQRDQRTPDRIGGFLLWDSLI